MIIINTIESLQKQLVIERKAGKTVGFVPTMGALHEGHLSLIRKAGRQNGLVVCSIFVNPTQFNDKSDFDKYPVQNRKDAQMLEKAGCDLLFLPSVKEMYPKGFTQADPIDFGFLTATLEGEFRPGHFAGMAQIVEKLLLAVQPNRLYMGQKDYQQAMICADLISRRKMKVELVVCPIKRETDGLAMSSRNRRLSRKARSQAPEIYKTLKWVKREFRKLPVNHFATQVEALEIAATDKLQADKVFQVEYLAIRDVNTLKPLRKPGQNAVAVVACWLGGVRLIDNLEM
ncbi:MAG: pantoate--beta-alanine ligase [Chitinophagales bacterium]